MDRVYNFAAGPAAMPEEALRRAAEEMLCYGDSGMSVMEMSHRSAAYQAIFDHTVSLLRELMDIPAEYDAFPGNVGNNLRRVWHYHVAVICRG